jgi:serine phosphatase RsbU (regulator of sigma subunit)
LPLPLPVPNWSKPIILALLLLALGLGIRSRQATRRARRLERHQTSLLRDLDTMQAALVPVLPASIGGLAVSAAYRPAEGPAAGGDFYDVFAIEPGLVAVILGDVAGHGHDALEQAALTRYTLRAYMQAASEPRAALALTGRAFADPSCAQLATVAVAVYDHGRGTLTYALAGHPPPILLGGSAPDSPTVLSSPPLGWDVPTGRRQRTVTLPRGARVCLFSDGLIEARCDDGPGGSGLLGRERLRELLEALPPDSGATELLAQIRDRAEATPDDMAACILTPSATIPGPEIDVEELEIDERPVAGGQLQAFLSSLGLERPEIQRLLMRVRTELATADTTLLRIDRSAHRLTVTATAPALDGSANQSMSPGRPALLRA